jgi:putative Mg2+ transporter-C (MgtC) family protein
MIVSQYGFSNILTEKNVVLDPSRIAAQVVSGIGFLGAGVILRGPFGITGLTSAATIWAVAAAGMLVGTGYGGAGLCLGLFIFGLLWLLTAIEHRYVGPCRYACVHLAFHSLGGKTLIRIEEVLDEYRVPPSSRVREAPAVTSDTREHLRVTFCHAHQHHREFLSQLASFSEIEEIRREEIDGRGAPERSPQ